MSKRKRRPIAVSLSGKIMAVVNLMGANLRPDLILNGGATTSIAAQIERFDGGSGSYTITNGVAFKPGDLTTTMLTAKQLRVLVGGVEQQIYVEALNGRHPDGSVEVALIQFIYTFSTPVSAEIRIGESRGTIDISKQTLNSFPSALIFPTSPTYLCSATPLWRAITPMSNRPQGGAWDTWEKRYSSTSPFTTAGSKIYYDDAVATSPNSAKYLHNYGTAAYDWACHHYEFFAMTGQGKYLWRGINGANFFIEYYARTQSPVWGLAEW